MNTLRTDINRAIKFIDVLLHKDPGFPLWKSISAQLEFIKSDFDEDGKFRHIADVDKVKKLILGVQSVREIEPGNPELSNLLCEIDYQYKKLYLLVE